MFKLLNKIFKLLNKMFKLINNNYLQLLFREIIEFLLYRGFPRPIWPANYDERSEGYFRYARDILQAKLAKGTRGEVKILISRKCCCTQFYRLVVLSSSKR